MGARTTIPVVNRRGCRLPPLIRPIWRSKTQPTDPSGCRGPTPAFAPHTCPIGRPECDGIERRLGGRGAGRRRSIRRRMLANRLLGIAASAGWNVTWRRWRTTLAPILIGLSRSVAGDQCSAALGKASVRRKLPNSSASACSGRHTSLLRMPWRIHCLNMTVRPVDGRKRVELGSSRWRSCPP